MASRINDLLCEASDVRNDSSSATKVCGVSFEDLATRSDISSEHVLLESKQPIDANEHSEAIKQGFSFRSRLLKRESASICNFWWAV